MAKRQYQTRLPDDTADQVDEYADRRNINRSEAVRRLVTEGVEQIQPDQTPKHISRWQARAGWMKNRAWQSLWIAGLSAIATIFLLLYSSLVIGVFEQPPYLDFAFALTLLLTLSGVALFGLLLLGAGVIYTKTGSEWKSALQPTNEVK